MSEPHSVVDLTAICTSLAAGGSMGRFSCRSSPAPIRYCPIVVRVISAAAPKTPLVSVAATANPDHNEHLDNLRYLCFKSFSRILVLSTPLQRTCSLGIAVPSVLDLLYTLTLYIAGSQARATLKEAFQSNFVQMGCFSLHVSLCPQIWTFRAYAILALSPLRKWLAEDTTRLPRITAICSGHRSRRTKPAA